MHRLKPLRWLAFFLGLGVALAIAGAGVRPGRGLEVVGGWSTDGTCSFDAPNPPAGTGGGDAEVLSCGILPLEVALIPGAGQSFEFRFILENLVTNAIRAMRSSKERVLSIETATDGTMCSIRIGDTGIGMGETTAGKLFEAKDDERDGGFGMPNTRLRLQECRGDIVLERTAPGEGTTFLLSIPHWTPNTGESDV
jgi:signal transduction histidine kinase